MIIKGKSIKQLEYDWDEVGSGMVKQIVEKLNEVIEELNKLKVVSIEEEKKE